MVLDTNKIIEHLRPDKTRQQAKVLKIPWLNYQ